MNEYLNYFLPNASSNTPASSIGEFLYGITGSDAANQFTSIENAKDRLFQHNEAELAYRRELNADATAIQRRVADLESAGFNPLMAVQGINPGTVSANSVSGASGHGASSGGSTVMSALFRGLSQILSTVIRATK